jgi:Uma2 family endonuclease
VKATLKLACRATYADYLAAEQNSPRRHEFIDGVIVCMAGSSDEHNAIAACLSALLGARVRSGCWGLSAHQRFWIEATQRARYSDASIICGKPAHPTHDRETTTNPTVIVEVLSPTTEGDDEGEKRHDFQSLPTLQAYVLVAQDARRVSVYRRSERGEWRPEPEMYRSGDSFELPALTYAIPVDEVYEGVLDEAGRSLLR